MQGMNVFTNQSPVEQADEYLQNVERIVASGGEIPDDFRAIAEAWRAVGIDAARAVQAVEQAVASGASPETVQSATLAAATTQTAGAVAGVRKRIAPAVLRALGAAYQPVGRSNYNAIARLFDEAAGRFTACAEKAPVAQGPESVVGVPSKVGQAWIEAADHAAELDRLLPLLSLSAEMTGAISDKGGDDARMDDWHLGLCCDPGTAHRRRLWEAWESRGRVGRWGALLALGCTIRAADLGTFAFYRRPKPMETRTQRVGPGYRQYKVDPEDADFKPLESNPKSTIEKQRDAENRAGWELADAKSKR